MFAIITLNRNLAAPYRLTAFYSSINFHGLEITSSDDSTAIFVSLSFDNNVEKQTATFHPEGEYIVCQEQDSLFLSAAYHALCLV